MPNPTVCAVMLANGRPEMVRRAIASFRSQTYQEKRLLIWDTSPGCGSAFADADSFDPWIAVPDVNRAAFQGSGIGKLRNAANKYAAAHYTTSDTRPEIFVHFDSDDFSHPNRIAEQVALLQSSGADCVGYREMLFWRGSHHRTCLLCGVVNGKDWAACHRCNAPLAEAGIGDRLEDHMGQAWLYSHPMPTYALGTSLCYFRSVWEANPFIDGNQEDWHFIQKVRTVGVSAFGTTDDGRSIAIDCRMIASIHGGNTCSKITPAADEWRRAPEWDSHCQRIMEGSCG